MPTTPSDQLLYRVNEVADILGLGMSKVYNLIREGQLRAVRVGGHRIRIPRDSLERYIASLPSVVPEPDDDTEDEPALTTRA